MTAANRLRAAIRSHADRFAPPTEDAVVMAALLTWLDIENDEAIARRLGISRRTLCRWRARPEYQGAYSGIRLHTSLLSDLRAEFPIWGVIEFIPASARNGLRRRLSL